MTFCDFCTCEMCQNGIDSSGFKDHHAETSEGKWICFTCYHYDECTKDGPNRNWNGPCEEDGFIKKDCIHRPKIIGEWIK